MRKFYFLAYLIFLTGTVEFITRPASASTFFAPDSDTALLFNLVSNTASQLNELEKLVSNAEKYTGLMEKYNQIARDQYFRAERIHYLAQNYVELSKKDPRDLESLNSAIRSLKSETESLKSLIREYRQDEAKNEYQEGVLSEKLRHSGQELNFANGQVMRSGEIAQTNEAQKMTAQNTSLIYKSQVENNQISSAIAEKLTEQNKLKNRELKDEAIRKDERDAYYKISNQGMGRSTLNRNNL
ncbi:MAG: hypothetical protein K2Q18_02285 [Bdellovibrionales bacterium]|nr:hypothetical protein [Bdellovibrionales bacterium]